LGFSKRRPAHRRPEQTQNKAWKASPPGQIHGIIDATPAFRKRRSLEKLSPQNRIGHNEPERIDSMHTRQLNRVSGLASILLSSAALLAVISGYFQPPQPEEGIAAHIFQLSIVALVPMILLFLATMDWKRPLRSSRLLAFPAAALAFAFSALYYLEHYR
jgi:hypothetical protein